MMAVITQLIAFLLCTFAAWTTIGAVRRTTADDPGPARIKLAALITGPLLLPVIGLGIDIPAVLLYYLTGILLIYTVIYGITVALSVADHGLGTTLHAIANLYGPQQIQPVENRPLTETRRQQPRHREEMHRDTPRPQYTADPPDEPPDEPQIWTDQQ